MNAIELVSQYGFPIVAAIGLCGFVYYIWTWVTKEIKPVLTDANKALISLVDGIRALDQDLIRLKQTVDVVLQLRGKKIRRHTDEDQTNNH